MAQTAPPKRRWLKWTIGAVVVVVLVAVVAPFVYFTFIQGDPPPKLSLSDVTTTTGAGGSTGRAPSAPLAGTWTVGAGSTAGYRVKEELFNQSNTAVARTDKVTGTVVIAGTKVTSADLSVDMASIASVGNSIDGAFADRRDEQFRGRIMSTDQFPTSTFKLTRQIDLAPVPKDGVEATYSATGELTMHGTTKTVTIPLTAKRTGNTIAVQGILTVTFSDYGIDNPSGGPASVGDSGQLEFLVQLQLGS